MRMDPHPAIELEGALGSRNAHATPAPTKPMRCPSFLRPAGSSSLSHPTPTLTLPGRSCCAKTHGSLVHRSTLLPSASTTLSSHASMCTTMPPLRSSFTTLSLYGSHASDAQNCSCSVAGSTEGVVHCCPSAHVAFARLAYMPMSW